jgi:hypothetical protein
MNRVQALSASGRVAEQSSNKGSPSSGAPWPESTGTVAEGSVTYRWAHVQVVLGPQGYRLPLLCALVQPPVDWVAARAEAQCDYIISSAGVHMLPAGSQCCAP